MAKKIPLTQGQFAIVDDEDFEWLNRWKWCAMRRGVGHPYYAVTKESRAVVGEAEARRNIYMHRKVMRAPLGQEVDHIVCENTLDNRRSNLRFSTRHEQILNRGKYRTNKAGFKGVFECKTNGKWRAQIAVSAVKISLGYFHEKIDAARTYDRAAIQYHGRFAKLNFPREEYVNG